MASSLPAQWDAEVDFVSVGSGIGASSCPVHVRPPSVETR